MGRETHNSSTKTKKIALAFSGGLDSTISAVMLAKAGYAVHAVYFNFWKWQDTGNHVQEITKAVEDINRVIDADFSIIDAEDKMHKAVIEDFILQLGEGKTPSPCIRCNPMVKFKLLTDFADARNIEYIATGHYARVVQGEDGSFHLMRAVDRSKDQSYMLCYLNQDILRRLVFPLGETTKKEIRGYARELGLKISNEPESQDLCFLNQHSYQDFIRHFSPEILIPGEIVDRDGNVLGKHNGLALYTIGQRKGIRIAAQEAYYVLSKDIVHNQLIVGFKTELGHNRMMIANVNWIDNKEIEKCECDVKIRYRSKLFKGVLQKHIKEGEYIVKFEEKLRDITPGQYAVFYKDETVLGGGMILKAVD